MRAKRKSPPSLRRSATNRLRQAKPRSLNELPKRKAKGTSKGSIHLHEGEGTCYPKKRELDKEAKARRTKLRAADLTEPVIMREDSPELPRVVPSRHWTSVDLFCGAGGITEGFRRAGFDCLYANDINDWAIKTFRANHPNTLADNRPVEEVDPAKLRRELGVGKGELDILVGGPPCQGFSINAPERFLDDPRNSLFRHYVRFLDEFQPKSLLVENVPGMFPCAA